MLVSTIDLIIIGVYPASTVVIGLPARRLQGQRKGIRDHRSTVFQPGSVHRIVVTPSGRGADLPPRDSVVP
ncbi:MAG: hypothetical protein QNK37_15010 [Acidobacteriota bacterium]|nr:hypothetical protein [Acidobacteriota bacterium]